MVQSAVVAVAGDSVLCKLIGGSNALQWTHGNQIAQGRECTECLPSQRQHGSWPVPMGRPGAAAGRPLAARRLARGSSGSR